MSSQSPYQPPSAVVAPAFNELLQRMRRARVRISKDGIITTGPGGSSTAGSSGVSGLPRRGVVDDDLLNADERQVWAYGVEERQRVIERTLALVFAQWALHRFAVRHVPLRAIRVLYAGCCTVGTIQFINIRAKRVTEEMFARIVALPSSSRLANEARIILAEMEGPDGDYFRAVCRDKQFDEDLHAIVAAIDLQGESALTDQNLHPQLRLKPRLLEDDMVKHPAVKRRGRGLRDAVEDGPKDDRRIVVRSGTAERGDDRRPPPARREDSGGYGSSRMREEHNAPSVEQWRGPVVRNGGRKGANDIVGKVEEPESFVSEDDPKPFDFAKAAGVDVSGERENQLSDTFRDGEWNQPELTPSQKRAQERRERRRRARERELKNGDFDGERRW